MPQYLDTDQSRFQAHISASIPTKAVSKEIDSICSRFGLPETATIDDKNLFVTFRLSFYKSLTY